MVEGSCGMRGMIASKLQAEHEPDGLLSRSAGFPPLSGRGHEHTDSCPVSVHRHGI